MKLFLEEFEGITSKHSSHGERQLPHNIQKIFEQFDSSFHPLDREELFLVNGGSNSTGLSSNDNVSSAGYGGGGNNNPAGGGSDTSTSTTTSSGSGGGSGSGSTTTDQPPIQPQVPSDPTLVHCDINAFNAALQNGISNPGTWNGNDLTVDQIFNNYYSDRIDTTPAAGSSGYMFFDWGSTPGNNKDHMEFYSVSADGLSYTVWETIGVNTPVSKTRYFSEDANGRAGSTSNVYFVPF